MTRRIIIAALLLAGCVAHAETDDEWDTAIGQTEQVTKGLVAYWAMRNSGTTVYDEGAGGLNGTAAGGVTFGYEHGAVGFGASFDGANDVISIAHTAAISFNRSDPFSLTFWGKTANRIVVTKFNAPADGNQAGYQAGTELSGTMSFMLRGTTGTTDRIFVQSSTTGFNNNQWHFFAATYDGSGAAAGALLYANGALIAKTTTTDALGTDTVNAKPLSIQYVNSGATYHSGQTDEVRIYNRALTADEIKQLYRMGALPRGIK
jgi:hypothetical protein